MTSKPTSGVGGVQIRKTIKQPGRNDIVKVYSLPKLSSRTVGEGVTGKVIYDLQKRGKSEHTMGDKTYIFEWI